MMGRNGTFLLSQLLGWMECVVKSVDLTAHFSSDMATSTVVILWGYFNAVIDIIGVQWAFNGLLASGFSH
jgi:hypothetical protein